LAIPPLSLALVLWAAASRRLASGPRRVAMGGAILLACGSLTLVRTGGIIGDGASDIHWRWSKTPEERLLAQASDEPLDLARGGGTALPLAPATAAPPAPAAVETAADWPGFGGPGRDSIIRGVRIATDWSASPPVQMWRQPIGPG